MVIAPGFHLLPFRTEKLSPVAPMVLSTRRESRSPPFFQIRDSYQSNHLMGVSFLCVSGRGLRIYFSEVGKLVGGVRVYGQETVSFHSSLLFIRFLLFLRPTIKSQSHCL